VRLAGLNGAHVSIDMDMSSSSSAMRSSCWAVLTWGAMLIGSMLGHRSRGGEKDESAHRMQHVYVQYTVMHC
jgi:hypothetical protein